MVTLSNSSTSKFIVQAELNVLKPATELAAVAANAVYNHELASIARECNLAANTGAVSVAWNKPISENAKKVLSDNGYRVQSVEFSAAKDSMYTISWA